MATRTRASVHCEHMLGISGPRPFVPSLFVCHDLLVNLISDCATKVQTLQCCPPWTSQRLIDRRISLFGKVGQYVPALCATRRSCCSWRGRRDPESSRLALPAASPGLCCP